METTAAVVTPARGAAPVSDTAVVDYLRGLAALGVALYHVRVTLWVGWREIAATPERFSAWDRALAWLSAPLPFLGSFVMLFFVISGFCIHWPWAGNARRFELRTYASRRFFRIYPPYFAAVVFSAAACLWLGQAHLGRIFTASVFMVQNYLGAATAGSGSAQLATNWSLWSLPVELELYALYPLLLGGARRWGADAMLALTIAISVAAVGSARGPDSALYVAVWFAGAWLAERWRSRTLGLPPLGLTLGAIAALALAATSEITLRGAAWKHLGFGLFYFWVVWVLLTHPAWWRHLRPRVAASLAWLGARSYSFYLLHFPLFYLLGEAWRARMGDKPHSLLVPLLAVAAILPMVAAFYRFVELPSHRLAKRLAGGT
jgi:peptidoglycan/LPS O-acetylase OafA/YrhL